MLKRSLPWMFKYIPMLIYSHETAKSIAKTILYEAEKLLKANLQTAAIISDPL